MIICLIIMIIQGCSTYRADKPYRCHESVIWHCPDPVNSLEPEIDRSLD